MHPISTGKPYKTIVFCDTKVRCDQVAQQLQNGEVARSVINSLVFIHFDSSRSLDHAKQTVSKIYVCVQF